MTKVGEFIEKYLSKYLSQCQKRNPFVEEERYTNIPPTSKELEQLISYLSEKDVDPVIIGSIAVIKHLKLTTEDIHARTFRPTQELDLLISKKLPDPPPGWHCNEEIREISSWISPTGGYVEFLMAQDMLPKNDKIEKDPESIAMGCPVADLLTLFKLKLNSSREKDLADLMSLARRVGIPQEVDKHLWNDIQMKNLELLRLWAKLNLGKDQRL